VTATQATSGAALAGVMFREALTANSREASLLLTSAGAGVFGRRTSVGGTLATSTATAQALPYWVKLVRSGNSFTGVPLDQRHHLDADRLIGHGEHGQHRVCGSCRHLGKAGTLNTATFDSVSVA
jgi:hypothetical protein